MCVHGCMYLYIHTYKYIYIYTYLYLYHIYLSVYLSIYLSQINPAQPLPPPQTRGTHSRSAPAPFKRPMLTPI